jgi:hypothetical protein
MGKKEVKINQKAKKKNVQQIAELMLRSKD